MDYKIIITELAEYDLDSILEYMIIKLDNRVAADTFLRELEKRIALLRHNPYIYALCDDFYLCSNGYRKFLIGSYVILYKINDRNNDVYILRLFYGKQEYDKYL